MSTLFFLIFSSLFIQMIIKISGNHILQLRQFSEAYQAKSALNMSESLLREYIEVNEGIPQKGKVNTSLGPVRAQRTSDDLIHLTLTLSNHTKYSKFIKIEKALPEIPEEELNDEITELISLVE